MISVADSNMNKETTTINEEDKTAIEEAKEMTSMETDKKDQEESAVASPDEANTSKDEQTTNTEESEKEGDGDVSSKSESEMTDSEGDAQPLFEQPIILDGKRSRRPTSRLDISDSLPAKKELTIPQGHGKPLGEIEYINYQITHASTDALSRMRTICFGRRGNQSTMRKHLREFKGFEFSRDSEEYEKHLNHLVKLKKDQLKSISNILGLPAAGRNTDHAERILNFLLEPLDEGKRVQGKKSTGRTPKKRSHNSKGSIDTDQETKNEKPELNHDVDYANKAGKKPSNKRPSNEQTPTNSKRKKRTPAASDSKENQETTTVIDEHKHNDEEIVKIRILLTDSQFQLYKKRLFEHEVTNDPRLLFCPQVNCDHVLILPEEQINSTEQAITCTQCQTTFCLKCRCQWHPNQPCSDLLTPDEMNAESNIKRCVRCRFPLERTDGCAQITCINCKHMFCWYCLKSLDNDFFLLHYERGPCRNRLGHSRASLFLHRLLVVGLFIVLTILVILASPLLMLMAPCLICYRYKQLKNYFNNSTMWRRTVQEENASTIEQQPIISLLPSWNLDTCNISTV
ncbi:unnamed protein product [Rotaria magnacalcarata]|uniref:RING-type domain-containing protein n=1 Tax=Rotaria magnacalcarata TaxID=392030 RepID=A0A819IQA3_9BILA|nr:unnamed protein product [Rotaria magnacalcarata]